MQNKESLLLSPENGRDAMKTVLAAGGLLAAFGVASCCALPVALSLLGISAASLVGVGYLAAQYQQELFYADAICLGASAFIISSDQSQMRRAAAQTLNDFKTLVQTTDGSHVSQH